MSGCFKDGKVATAGKAEYDKEARVIVFSGSPKISLMRGYGLR